MKTYFSQKTFKDVKLGTCSDTISQSGCFLVSFVNLLKEMGVAETNPIAFNKVAYPNGGCLAVAGEWAKMYNLNYKKSTSEKGLCIAETNRYKSKGVPQHFFLYKDGKVVDPLDMKPEWKVCKYNIVSYRVFSKTKLTPTVEPQSKEVPETPKDTVETPIVQPSAVYELTERLEALEKRVKTLEEEKSILEGIIIEKNKVIEELDGKLMDKQASEYALKEANEKIEDLKKAIDLAKERKGIDSFTRSALLSEVLSRTIEKFYKFKNK